MTSRYKPHQMLPPPAVGDILNPQKINNLGDIGNAFKKREPRELRSHRRMLLQTLRYMRTHEIEATNTEWTTFATELVQTSLSWDEAKNGRYRYRIPGLAHMSPKAAVVFLKSSLDQLPAGWHESQQTRQHYRYVAKHLPAEFKQFDVQDDGPVSLAQSMRSLVSEKFPAPHSFFMQTLANLQDAPPKNMWTQTLSNQKPNDKWVQAAFALARHPTNLDLAKSIHDDAWFPKRNPLPDTGISLSFFEIIQRLPAQLGRPSWMQKAFVQMLSSEKNDRLVERGWKAVNLNEEERFELILGLACDYPSRRQDSPLKNCLAYKWTMPAEERKARALTRFATFGGDQSDVSATTTLDNAREWIGLLVPELQPVLDICGDNRPGDAIALFQQFLSPAETLALGLPTSFDSAEMGDLVPK